MIFIHWSISISISIYLHFFNYLSIYFYLSISIYLIILSLLIMLFNLFNSTTYIQQRIQPIYTEEISYTFPQPKKKKKFNPQLLKKHLVISHIIYL